MSATSASDFACNGNVVVDAVGLQQKAARPAGRFFFALAALPAGLRAAQNEDLAALSRQVKELMAQGRFEQAIPLCEQLVKAVPGNTGLLLNLGLAEQMAGHPDKAAPRFEEVLRTEPGNVPALNSLASSELQLGQPQAAIPPLKKLLALQPSNNEARGMLASAFLGAGDLDEAAVQYRKLTAVTPTDSKAWYGLGKTYQEQSARLFDRLEKKGPQSAYVAALIGASRLKAQQYHSAFFFFKEAERSLPPIRGVHSGLAVIYGKAGHAGWAAIEERKEDSLPPPNCANNPSECFFVQNRYAEAAKSASPSASDAQLYWGIKAYDQLALEVFARLEALPESLELHALHAQLAHGRNQDLEAAAEWRAALKLSPGNSRLEGELTTSLFLAHDYNAAIPMIEKLRKGDERSPDLNFMMGESLLRTEQPENAVPYLEDALRANPNMLPAHASLGLALAKVNRDREAIPHLEKALELDDDGALHYQLSHAYQQEGNTTRATALMAQYQEIQKRNQEEKEEITKDVQIVGP
ncbi:MAG TPA: tetratricopeptide repeat protein [Bryobacteraceae bacterium]|nr:tetratricopeptide repeat protein [Bryobacteraceae bacterium]